jgi:hypothetical protein
MLSSLTKLSTPLYSFSGWFDKLTMITLSLLKEHNEPLLHT